MNYHIYQGVTTDGTHYYPVLNIRSYYQHPITDKVYTNIPQGLLNLIIHSSLRVEDLTEIYINMRTCMKLAGIQYNHTGCLELIASATLIRAFIDPVFDDDDDLIESDEENW